MTWMMQVRLRFFQDDLAEGLRRMEGDARLSVRVDPLTDSLVTAYVNRHFVVRTNEAAEAVEEADGSPDSQGSDPTAPLPGAIVASGEEMDGSEPVWWYVFQYVSPEPVRLLDVDDNLLHELFDDQRNITRILHTATNKYQMYYSVAGAAETQTFSAND